MQSQSGTRIFYKLVVPPNLKPLKSGIYRTRIIVHAQKAKAGDTMKRKLYHITIRDCENLV